MPTCAVLGCGNYPTKTKGSEIRYYTFPKQQDLRKKWVEACARDEEFNFEKARICSIHFHASAFEVSMKHKPLNYHSKAIRNLKEDAIPTLNLFELPIESTTREMGSGKQKIKEAESRKQIIKDLLEAGPSTSTSNIQKAPEFIEEISSRDLSEVSDPMEEVLYIENIPQSSALALLEVLNPQALEKDSDIEDILETSALALSEISNPMDEVSDIEDICALELSVVSNPTDEASDVENIPESSALPLSEVSSLQAIEKVSDIENRPESSALALNKLIEQLRAENNTIRKEKETLEAAFQKVSLELEKYKAVLNQHFGPGQIKRLLNPGKNFRWTAQDIASSISLRSVSPKAYSAGDNQEMLEDAKTKEEMDITEQFVDENGIYDSGNYEIRNSTLNTPAIETFNNESLRCGEDQEESSNWISIIDNKEIKIETADFDCDEEISLNSNSELNKNCDIETISETILQRYGDHVYSKQHKCRFCDYAEFDESTLKKHADSIHSKTKRFKCYIKEHKCHLCEYVATEKNTLQNHLDSVHVNLNSKRHKCHFCDYGHN